MPGPEWPVAASAQAVADRSFCRALRAWDAKKAGHWPLAAARQRRIETSNRYPVEEAAKAIGLGLAAAIGRGRSERRRRRRRRKIRSVARRASDSLGIRRYPSSS